MRYFIAFLVPRGFVSFSYLLFSNFHVVLTMGCVDVWLLCFVSVLRMIRLLVFIDRRLSLRLVRLDISIRDEFPKLFVYRSKVFQCCNHTHNNLFAYAHACVHTFPIAIDERLDEESAQHKAQISFFSSSFQHLSREHIAYEEKRVSVLKRNEHTQMCESSACEWNGNVLCALATLAHVIIFTLYSKICEILLFHFVCNAIEPSNFCFESRICMCRCCVERVFME